MHRRSKTHNYGNTKQIKQTGKPFVILKLQERRGKLFIIKNVYWL